ncbi:restriction endonuclease subunit S [Streptomyces sp. NPDC050147]|uniref:restriction endonuclease subunit S n=1 Tax=Streptomyces sp. NPDC050147 TaxID=3155513 RepID=UPI003416F164
MGELPTGWVRATLGELGVEVQSGFASGKHNRDGEGILHLRPMNITRNGVMDTLDARYVVDESDRRVELGDVLFNNTNSPALVGKTAWVDSAEPLAFSNHMNRLRGPEGLDGKFLAAQLHHMWATGYFKSILNNHVNQASVSRKALLDTAIVVPPLAEQHRIVAKLDDQLAHIEAGEAALGLAADSFEHLIHAARSRDVWPADGDSLPEGWRWGVVGDVLAKIEAGRSFTCLPRTARDDEWGVIKVSAMTWGEFRADENKALPFEREPNSEYEIHSGDILVSRANTVDYVGAPVLVGATRPKLMLSDKSLRLVPKAEVDRDWLIEVLSSQPVRAQYSAAATGTSDSMRNISQVTVRSARIPIPPEGAGQRDVATAIADTMRLVKPLKRPLDEQAREAGRLRAALLHAAFTGVLVTQDPNDEPASALLERIRAQQAADTETTRRKRAPRTTSPAASQTSGRPVSSGIQEALPL